mmetsp:Transcript_24641/g.41810  ORF Transcript_24641/g.41810 Transcript_24641/m.41810 type:complete len:292 (+) Transcript_24641:360-1235(+)
MKPHEEDRAPPREQGGHGVRRFGQEKGQVAGAVRRFAHGQQRGVSLQRPATPALHWVPVRKRKHALLVQRREFVAHGLGAVQALRALQDLELAPLHGGVHKGNGALLVVAAAVTAAAAASIVVAHHPIVQMQASAQTAPFVVHVGVRNHTRPLAFWIRLVFVHGENAEVHADAVFVRVRARLQRAVGCDVLVCVQSHFSKNADKQLSLFFCGTATTVLGPYRRECSDRASLVYDRFLHFTRACFPFPPKLILGATPRDHVVIFEVSKAKQHTSQCSQLGSIQKRLLHVYLV